VHGSQESPRHKQARRGNPRIAEIWDKARGGTDKGKQTLLEGQPGGGESLRAAGNNHLKCFWKARGRRLRIVEEPRQPEPGNEAENSRKNENGVRTRQRDRSKKKTYRTDRSRNTPRKGCQCGAENGEKRVRKNTC